MKHSDFNYSITNHGRSLAIDGASNKWALSALWLRERAPDDETLDPATGQRLIEAADLPLDIGISDLQEDNDALAISFSDGHTSHFSIEKLLPELGITRPASEIAPTFWDAGLKSIPEADFKTASRDDAALSAMLDKLREFGFVRVSGVPTELEGMRGLTDLIGPIRRTNWGGIADVKSIPNAYDLTMTQRGLEPHTDNPYRDPIPGYICLHCLTNAAEGGDSTLVDGFRAAQRLREDSPQDYDCLTRLSPTFRYEDDSTFLESSGPLIELNSVGEVFRVRYSNRTERIPMHDPETLAHYYTARQHFYRLITSDELTLRLKLDEGDMLIMDNYRLFHGRAAFKLQGGIRHMRQGYLDRDSVSSRQRTLGNSKAHAA